MSEPPGYATIGEAAARSGLSAKMIRHYEEIGLLPPARRTEAGYRVYDAAAVGTLRFVRGAREVGFPIERIARLLDLWRDRGRASADVKALARAHVEDLRARQAAIADMIAALDHLAQACHGDDRPDCPILDGLAAWSAAGPLQDP